MKYGTSLHLDYRKKDKIEYIIQRRPEYVMMPDDIIVTRWNMILIMLLMYVATYMPYRICFHGPHEGMEFADWIELLVDFLFVIDIVINFFSAYYDNKTLLPVVKYKEIARNYITGYFFIDVISVIPFQYFNTSSD